jgi:hypothetical protein
MISIRGCSNLLALLLVVPFASPFCAYSAESGKQRVVIIRSSGYDFGEGKLRRNTEKICRDLSSRYEIETFQAARVQPNEVCRERKSPNGKKPLRQLSGVDRLIVMGAGNRFPLSGRTALLYYHTFANSRFLPAEKIVSAVGSGEKGIQVLAEYEHSAGIHKGILSLMGNACFVTSNRDASDHLKELVRQESQSANDLNKNGTVSLFEAYVGLMQRIGWNRSDPVLSSFEFIDQQITRSKFRPKFSRSIATSSIKAKDCSQLKKRFRTDSTRMGVSQASPKDDLNLWMRNSQIIEFSLPEVSLESAPEAVRLIRDRLMENLSSLDVVSMEERLSSLAKLDDKDCEVGLRRFRRQFSADQKSRKFYHLAHRLEKIDHFLKYGNSIEKEVLGKLLDCENR